MRKTTNEEFFWKRVKKTSSCWFWTGSKNKDGYGRMERRLPMSSHRYSYELHFRRIPEGKILLHRCDNPSCVNPRHLLLGSHKTNAEDRRAKGRSALGVRNGRAKLSEKTVRELRKTYVPWKNPMNKLAEKFNVCATTVEDALKNKTWQAVKP